MNQTNRFTAHKSYECNRCGSQSVYWVRSYRTGKPYLVNIASDGTTSRRDFHTCQQAQQAPVTPAPALVLAADAGQIDTSMADANISVLNTPHGEAVLAANRDVLVASLNHLMEAPAATKPATPASAPNAGALNPAPIQAPPATQAKAIAAAPAHKRVYACVSSACAKQGQDVTTSAPATKPVICTACKRICKLKGIAS